MPFQKTYKFYRPVAQDRARKIAAHLRAHLQQAKILFNEDHSEMAIFTKNTNTVGWSDFIVNTCAGLGASVYPTL